MVLVLSQLLVIFGNKSTGEEAYVLAKRQATEFDEIVAVYFDQNFQTKFENELKGKFDEVHYLISMADLELRYKCQEFAEKHEMIPYSLIHPTAVIEPSATIGAGCYIGQYAVISINTKIGKHCLIHIHASIGHDTTIDEHTVIFPGARIGGNVHIESDVLVGSNAFIYQGRRIGKGTQIDAMTYVHKSLPPGVIKSVRYQHLVDKATKRPVQ